MEYEAIENHRNAYVPASKLVQRRNPNVRTALFSFLGLHRSNIILGGQECGTSEFVVEKKMETTLMGYIRVMLGIMEKMATTTIGSQLLGFLVLQGLQFSGNKHPTCEKPLPLKECTSRNHANPCIALVCHIPKKNSNRTGSYVLLQPP